MTGRWLRARWRQLKTDAATLYYAARHPRMPWYAKALALFLVAYAFSPLDLIPDFIPLIGHLDDLILLPLGMVLVWKLTPGEAIEESRRQARDGPPGKVPEGMWGACGVIICWCAGAMLLGYWIWRAVRGV